MIDALLKRFQRLHMIGICGAGMSGIAEVLLNTGFRVTGSDLAENEVAKRLKELGAALHIGHDPAWVEDAEVVVYSSAIRDDNVELIAARDKKIPVIGRAEMLAELMRMKAGVAISGTHGKTTTTSLVGEVLARAGLDPTVIVGGRLRQLEGGVISGKGEILVAEADEFDKSFLRLTPTVVVITNIDSDHVECYGSFEELENAFVQFANSVPFYGRSLICIDEPSLQKILPRITRSVVTYGFSPQADVRARDAVFQESMTHFSVEKDGEKLGDITLPLPGNHNVMNAMAAVSVGLEFGVDFRKMKDGLQGFAGIHRRFEIHGEVEGVLVVDDFAHHPVEIEATLAAAKTGWKRRIIAVFQPHLYSRTLELYSQFGRALLGAETAIILPIYPAREDQIEGVTSRLIHDAARDLGHKDVHHLDDKSKVVELLKEFVEPGDMVIVLGAGDVYRLAPLIMEGLKS